MEWLLGSIVLLLLGLGISEKVYHKRRLNRIRYRIHVNGTRGKSSVTRLIAAGLRASGMRTVAKTTGTLPRIIMPDGTEHPVQRHSRPNVIEQKSIVREACRLRAEALVLECMAVQPRLQALCESKLVNSTHGVITNARPDHLDMMGPTERDVATALANTTPVRGLLFSCEKTHRAVFAATCQDRQSQLVSVEPEDAAGISDEEMAGFRYDEHKENVALALRVCESLGVDRATALRGMQQASPDPGASTTHQVDHDTGSLTFVNAFAANDPASTESAWKKALHAGPAGARRIAVFNCRSDRPDRSAQLGVASAAWLPADHYLLIGSGTAAFVRAARGSGIDRNRLTVLERIKAEKFVDLVFELAGEAAVIVGMGNIGGEGLEIVDRFRVRSRSLSSHSLSSHSFSSHSVSHSVSTHSVSTPSLSLSAAFAAEMELVTVFAQGDQADADQVELQDDRQRAAAEGGAYRVLVPQSDHNGHNLQNLASLETLSR